jgi:integrase
MQETPYTAKGRQRKRATRGTGRLYKRDATGRERPESWKGGGTFWLAYTIPSAAGGKGQRMRQALRDADGNPITDRRQAEAERRRVMAPFTTGEQVEIVKAIQAKLADAEAIHAAAIERAADAYLIADAWRLFHRHPNRPRCSDATLGQYESEFKRFSAWIGTRHPDIVVMQAVTEDHAIAYAAHLDAARITASTFNQHRNFLVMLWRVLRRDARLTLNPFEAIERRKLEKLARRKRALEPQEFEAILAAAKGDPDMHDMFVMLAWTGQRLVDVVKMRWGAVDFQRGILTLHPQKTAARTGKAVHPPLFPAAREVLNRRHDPAKVFRLDAFVFPDLVDEYERDRGATLSKRITEALQAAGLETNTAQTGTARRMVLYGAHSFRHYFVTQAAAAGMPGAMVRQITGHSTDDMLEHYQHIGAGYSIELARRIGGATTTANLAAREPLPAWARDLLETQTAENWQAVKAAILKGGAE